MGAGIQGWDNSIAQFLSGEMYVGPYVCATAGANCNLGLNNGLPFATDVSTGNFLAAPGDLQNVARVGNYVPIV